MINDYGYELLHEHVIVFWKHYNANKRAIITGIEKVCHVTFYKAEYDDGEIDYDDLSQENFKQFCNRSRYDKAPI